ncbi:E3 ubiquitin-protein ligase TRIM33-like isoform X2 [Ostrea edulis]|uniref:E3 ubiquitin-protein ligase TRIM33-like isoform X2 n=1 Tax=Ostrea edulis TaxID=37623 RepID=UPI0024AED989|nr:E3 ubiquitin-protein ligase TRIM33-like isoform X2 [Ostrea edulis]
MNAGSVTSKMEEKEHEINVITCPLCLRHYNGPKQLDCLHNFCEECLNAYITSDENGGLQDGKFTCPVCHIPTSVSVPASGREFWAGQLPNNNLIMSLADGVPFNSDTQVCKPCRREQKSTVARYWCRDCFEPLCEFCKGIHRKIKQINGHRINPLEEIRDKPGAQRLGSKTDETCTEHKGKSVELFCPGHRKLCCVVCFATHHRECPGIQTIDELSEDIKSAGDLAEVVDVMSEVIQRADEQIADKTQAATILNFKYAELTEKIELLTKKAIERLEVLRDESLNKFEKHHSKETKKIEHEKAVLHSSKLAMDLDMKYLEAVAKHGSPSLLFITSERLRHQIGYHQEILAVDRERAEDLDYKFEFNDQFLMTAEKMTSLGKLKVLRAQLKINNNDVTEQPSQVGSITSRSAGTYTVMSGKIPQVVIDNPDPFSLKLIKEKDYDGSMANERRIVWFTGGVFMSDGIHFLMADYNNRKIKKFKKDVYHPVMEFPLESAPCDIAAAGDNEVIVTLPHVCKIARYQIRNEGLKLLSAITTFSAPEGVACMEDKMVVSFGDCIKILGDDGGEVISIPTQESYTYTAPVVVSRDNKKFYHRDGETIVCRSKEGDEIFRYHDSTLREPAGLALDFEENIYVCDCKSNTIFQVTADGTQGRIIRSSRVCVGSPIGIGFDRTGWRLWRAV